MDATTLNELEQFYKTAVLPSWPIELEQGTKIADIPKMIESHFTVLRANPNNKTYEPFFDRLVRLREIIQAL
jgi:hypothetical protein